MWSEAEPHAVEIEFSCYILTLKSDDIWLDWWHQFINFPENQLTTLYAIQAALQCICPRSGRTASRIQNVERLDAVQTVHPHFKY